METFEGNIWEWVRLVHGKDGRLDKMLKVSTPFLLNIVDLAINMFEWEGLPNNLESYMIESILFWRGSAVFFNYTEDKQLVLPPIKVGELDVYGRMQIVSPMAYNGQPLPMQLRVYDSVTGDEKRNAVLILNNPNQISTYAFIAPFIEGLTYVYQSKMQNVIASRRPVIVKANRKTAQAINESFKKLFGDMETPIKAVYDDGVSNGLESVDLKVTYDQADYWDDIKNHLYLILSFLGIKNNDEVMKKERMNVPEVESNNEMIEAFRNNMLIFRQKACERINETFGLNVSVKYRYDNQEEKEEVDDNEEEQVLQADTE